MFNISTAFTAVVFLEFHEEVVNLSFQSREAEALREERQLPATESGSFTLTF